MAAKGIAHEANPNLEPSMSYLQSNRSLPAHARVDLRSSGPSTSPIPISVVGAGLIAPRTWLRRVSKGATVVELNRELTDVRRHAADVVALVAEEAGLAVLDVRLNAAVRRSDPQDAAELDRDDRRAEVGAGRDEQRVVREPRAEVRRLEPLDAAPHGDGCQREEYGASYNP